MYEAEVLSQEALHMATAQQDVLNQLSKSTFSCCRCCCSWCMVVVPLCRWLLPPVLPDHALQEELPRLVGGPHQGARGNIAEPNLLKTKPAAKRASSCIASMSSHVPATW
jgi:hypothetical protein